MASRSYKPEWAPTPPLSPDELKQSSNRTASSPPTGWRRDYAAAAFALRWMLREIRRWLLSLVGRKRGHTTAMAIEARQFAERMGGMWVILAHLASLGDELWGRAFCRELRFTRDSVRPMPSDLVRQIIDDELRSQGTCFTDEFSEFDETPMSTNSFSQVHRARLKTTGHPVTVRVRARDIERRVATDWRYLRVLSFLLKRIGVDSRLLADDLLFEVKLATDDLLDFRTEVTELKKIRRILGRRRIYVPLIFSRLSTEKLLITEYVQGASISDLNRLKLIDRERYNKWFEENNIKRNRVWSNLFNMHHELLFEHNLFYTELFAKNILLLRDSRIAFVSFGTIGTIDAELQRRYVQFCRAVLDRDFTKATETYLAMGPALPYKDLTGMKLSVGRALRNWESRCYIKRHRYHEKSLAAAVGIVARCASEHGLPKLWNLARLQKAEDILGDSLSFINRGKNAITALRRYEEEAQKRVIAQAFFKRKKDRLNNAGDIAQLNLQLIENLEHDGKYLRQRLLGFKGRIGRVAEVLGRLLRITSNVIILMLFIEAFIYIKHDVVASPGVAHGPIGRIFARLQVQNTLTWVVLIVGLFYFSRFLQRLARSLFAKEIRPGDVL